MSSFTDIINRMKIYFAGSITGGRKDREVYAELISHLKKYGQVLTSHVSDPDLSQTGEQGLNTSPEYIYQRDMGWMDIADVVVAEVTQPSLGVGYELAKADSRNLPVLVLCQPLDQSRKLSGLIAGNPKFIVKTYVLLEQAKKYIDEFIPNLKK